MSMIRGTLERTFEFYDVEQNAQSIEVRIHFTFTPGCEAQTYGPAERCYPAEAAEWEFDYAERECRPFEVTAACFLGRQPEWIRLLDGEWLQGWCRDVLQHAEECDLTDALADQEPDWDRERDERIDRELTERRV